MLSHTLGSTMPVPLPRARRFSHALGMPMIRKSDQSSGNSMYSSYTLLSNELCFIFTSPYSAKCVAPGYKPPMASYSIDQHWEFVKTHGLAVRAVGGRARLTAAGAFASACRLRPACTHNISRMS